MENEKVLKIERLTKRFTGIVANDQISLEVGRSEIHALCGENGAGKSTLCKMLTGVYHPDAGRIILNGNEMTFSCPLESLRAGIAMVYQERNLVGHLTGAQNICLGNEPARWNLIQEEIILRESERLREKLGIDVPLDIPVEHLGAGSQQVIEIIRALYRNPFLLILDEPTASLGEGEIEPFLKFILNIRNNIKLSIIFISHKIEEVFSIADRITVITDGKKVLTSSKDLISKEEVISAMIRSDRIQKVEVVSKDFFSRKIILESDMVELEGHVHHIPMIVHEGEAVGLYGLVGSGRTECMEAIGGIRKSDHIKAKFDGQVIEKDDSLTMIKRGFILTPEKRANGAFRGLSIEDNICNLFIEDFSTRSGFILFKKMREFAEMVLKKNEVRFSNILQNIVELSGGNIQKVIIGRSIEIRNLKLLVLDEPTAGMDIGAKNEVYRKIRNLVDEENKGVIFISSELDELISTCDRIYVFAGGHIVGNYGREEYDRHSILASAIGKKEI